MRLAIVKNLEVFFFQVAHGVALLIADYNRHKHSVDVHYHLARRILRILCLLSGRAHARQEHQATRKKRVKFRLHSSEFLFGFELTHLPAGGKFLKTPSCIPEFYDYGAAVPLTIFVVVAKR